MAALAFESDLVSDDLLKKAFELIDTNGDGNLSKEEFTSGCTAMGFELTNDQSSSVFALIDDDGSGEIDYNEFSGFMVQKQKNENSNVTEFRDRLISIMSDVSVETLRNAFDLIDLNGDGDLQKEEFTSGCKTIGISLKDSDLNSIFSCIDDDGSGEIDFGEFCSFFKCPPNKGNQSFGLFRQRLMKLLKGSNRFQDHYHFKSDDIVVIQHFKGENITSGNGEILGIDGKFDKNAQFKCEILENGKKAYIRSCAANGKYIQIKGDKVVLSAEKTDDAIFKIHRVSIGHFKLESELNSGQYLCVDLKSSNVQIGKGGPFCRLRVLRRGIEPNFSKSYVFALKKVVILEHKFGRHFRIESEKNDALNANGGRGTLAQFEAIPSEGGKCVQLMSVANHKYLRINDEKTIDVSGADANDECTKFVVHPVDGPNHVRLESAKNKGCFVSCNDKLEVVVGDGSKSSLITIYQKN